LLKIIIALILNNGSARQESFNYHPICEPKAAAKLLECSKSKITLRDYYATYCCTINFEYVNMWYDSQCYLKVRREIND
jgi:hypothetical protein